MSEKKRVFTVLVIDGGGVRGVIPAKILQELEERTGKPTAELFDMIAVTSTGSLIGAGLASPNKKNSKKPKFSAKDVVNLYKEKVRDIFPDIKFRNLKHLVPGTDGYYDVENFEQILKDVYGDIKLGESLTNLIITAVDIKSNRPIWIENIHNRQDKDGWCNMNICDAVRASCTAPSLFQTKYFYTSPNPHTPETKERYVFLDGGLFAGTLPRYAYTKAKQIAPPDAEIILLHLGTLNKETGFSPEEFNNASPLEMLKETLGLMTNMTLKATLKDLQTDMGDRLISLDGPMHEYEPEITIEPRLDDADPENMEALEKYADKMIKDKHRELERLEKILKYKIYADKRYSASKKSLSKLVKLLREQKNPKELNILYTKIAEYSSDTEQENLSSEDKKLFDIVQKLSDTDQAKLERVYITMKEKRAYQNKSSTKLAKSLKSIFMPWTRKKKAVNDNKNTKNIKKKNDKRPPKR